jgi:hypothetical protein
VQNCQTVRITYWLKETTANGFVCACGGNEVGLAQMRQMRLLSRTSITVQGGSRPSEPEHWKLLKWPPWNP